MTELELKYGCNPNQKPARIFMKEGELPVTVLNGKPGYINFLDALNSWQLVRELKQATGLPAAASFKHVSPAGAALGLPLDDTLKKMYFCEGLELSPLACAYARARGADRMSSFGDWIALSDVCDESTAKVIQHEVTDGIIAPGYTDEALAILKAKRKGGYNIVQIDPDYVPEAIEYKQVFGIVFEQGRNELKHRREHAGESGHRQQDPDCRAEAGSDALPDHPEIHPVQQRVLRPGRPGDRRGRRPAEPHSLHPSGRQQGRHLAAAPPSQGAGPALPGGHRQPQPGQCH